VESEGHAVVCPLEAEDLTPLLGALAALGRGIKGLQVTEPTLEEVFLELIGAHRA
jgi:hypothetical protein